ncbi:GAF domain-containing protein [Belliella pelovolcani]|uniref:GAF domain-containing protein n=1 Tax=Belliella pelovolcani TaxID=529505 RepID=UPI003918DED7
MDRLEDLKKYNILDTPPEHELDELAKIASAIFDTPVSIVSFIDDKRQWYKAKIGLDFNEVKIEETFCKYTLGNPDDILIIDNPLEDDRVKDNKLVTCDGGIKFYASAPLVSNHGNVLGTVCVLDYKERKFSDKKYEALRLISKKVMDYLETRRAMFLQSMEIEYSAERLKRLTDLAPGAIFKLSFSSSGELRFIFISEGIQRLIPELCLKKLKNDPKVLLSFIFGEDKEYVYNLFKYSYDSLEPIEAEYLVTVSEGVQKWHWIKANPIKLNSDEVVWFGVIQDITQKKNHLEALEKMLFDISHVIRKPIANILGIANILQSSEITKVEKMEMCSIIFEETQNLDDYINELNSKYNKLKKLLKKDWKEN